MNKHRQHGGSAFPCGESTSHEVALAAVADIPRANVPERDRVYLEVRALASRGMTLRDYFAGQVLTSALLASVDQKYTANAGIDIHETIARDAYSIADAMLRRREQ